MSAPFCKFIAYIVLIQLASCQSLNADYADAGPTLPAASSISNSKPLYSIEGKVFPVNEIPLDEEWFASTRVLVNHGQYLGFMR